jgi:hypothetical protein
MISFRAHATQCLQTMNCQNIRHESQTFLKNKSAVWVNHTPLEVPVLKHVSKLANVFVVRFCFHRTIPMMRFAAYYGFTIDCNCNIAAYNLVIVGRNLPETCSGLNLARRLGTARHRKDIYQRIFISYPISKNLQKGYFLSFFGAGYFEDIISYF